MKLFNILTTFLPVLFANIPIVSRATEIKTELSLVYITPLIYDNTTKIYLKGTGTRTKPLDVTIKIYNDYFPKGTTIATATTSLKLNKVIEYDNSCTRERNTIEILYGPRKGTIEKTSHIIPKATIKSISIDDNQKVVEESPCYAFSPLFDWRKITSEYTFNSFNDFYIPNFYHKLDLSDFKLNMSSNNYAVFDCEAELYIQNYKATYFYPDFEGYSLVPLKVVKNDNNIISFAPSVDLYVNKETLEMSFEQHDKYVKTRHFYLPRNEFRNQEEYIFTLVFKNFGNCHSKLKHSFKFKALSNTIGDCINSEYCIIKE